MSIDARKVLKQIELKYGLKLPRKVTAIDYDEEAGIFICDSNADATEGDPTSDGKIIVHYNKNGKNSCRRNHRYCHNIVFLKKV